MSRSPQSLSSKQHSHQFLQINQQGEKNTRYVLYLTLITMLVEIIAGSLYGSMALLADGWHMGTHAAAFLITLFAYSYARKHQHNPDFTFGTGKVNVLGGYTSAIALGLVALIMLVESISRIFSPERIHFNEAIIVAVIGLSVNLLSALLLKDHHSHSHGPEHHHEHEHEHEHHHDHNLQAAYLHVLADALTSILAIAALLLGKYLHLNWLDPIMGIVGAIIITRWAWLLLKQTSPILLDANVSQQYRNRLQQMIEAEPEHQVYDLHVWPVSANHFAAIISLVAPNPKPLEYYQTKLAPFDKVVHLTIEVSTCGRAECHYGSQQK